MVQDDAGGNGAEPRTGFNEASQHDRLIVMIVCRRCEEVNKNICADADMERNPLDM